MSSSSTTKPHLPVTRIHTIMQSSSDAETISKESAKMMTKACELFIRTLAIEGYRLTNNGKKLDYKHLAEIVNNDNRYEFVRDIMPKMITFGEYKKNFLKQNNDDDDDDDDDEDTDNDEDGDDCSDSNEDRESRQDSSNDSSSGSEE